MNIVLGITGSVSAYKTPWLVRDLRRAGHDVRVVMTHAAQAFVAPLALEATSQHAVIINAFDPAIQEGGSWHVHLAQWASVMLIAPCSATTLAKLSLAQCDSAVTLVACSLPTDVPLLIAPAMDSDMWQRPATQRNVAQLVADGAVVVPPAAGELASGLQGTGRLPDLNALLNILNEHTINVKDKTSLTESPTASNEHTPTLSVLITAGPTHEPIDPVRSIVNHSTGTMGFALARAATERGMLVTLIAGPVTLATPIGVSRINVVTAQQMHHQVQQHARADIIIMAAAVADFTPAHPANAKIKKGADNSGLILELERTTDILQELGRNTSSNQVVIGFALETNNVIENARLKLEQKNVDAIIANQAGAQDSGFGTGMNTITIVTTETEAPYPAMSKRACAEAILDAALRIHANKIAAGSTQP